jgi:hypothetical protein
MLVVRFDHVFCEVLPLIFLRCVIADIGVTDTLLRFRHNESLLYMYSLGVRGYLRYKVKQPS